MSENLLLVYASGTPTGGGGGFQTLVEGTRTGTIRNGRVAAVVSNHPRGGVWRRAKDLEVPFFLFESDEDYELFHNMFTPDLTCLSGWLLKVVDLDPRYTINIHPGPLEFGGPGMYGHHGPVDK